MRFVLGLICLMATLTSICVADTAATLKRWVIQPPAKGVYTGADGGPKSREGSCGGVSRAAGQTMQFCNSYYTLYDLPDVLTDGRTTAMAEAGTIPVLTFGCLGTGTPTSHGRVTYANIASNSEDANLSRDAAALKAYAAKYPKNPWLMIRPFHEFNVNIGNPMNHPNRNNCFSMPEALPEMQSEFVAAFRHVVSYMSSQGVTNVTWVWCPAVGPGTWERYGGESLLRGFYPGDAYVDWTCFDAYDKPSPGGGIRSAFVNVRFFAAFHKPIIIAETGECNSDSPRSRKCDGYTVTQSQFISDLARALQPGGSLSDVGIKAWMYFDQDVPYSGYNWSFDSAGLAAFRSMVNDPFFHPAMPSARESQP